MDTDISSKFAWNVKTYILRKQPEYFKMSAEIFT